MQDLTRTNELLDKLYRVARILVVLIGIVAVFAGIQVFPETRTFSSFSDALTLFIFRAFVVSVVVSVVVVIAYLSTAELLDGKEEEKTEK